MPWRAKTAKSSSSWLGDNDVTSGDDDDLIVTGQGDDVIDAGDGDNAVYAECRSGLDRELCRRR